MRSGRILVLALVLAAAAIPVTRAVARWQAAAAYVKFAEAWTHGNRAAAAEVAEDEAVRHALEERALRGLPSGSIIEAFRGTRYEVESAEFQPNGDLQREVMETIFFDPPGRTTALGGAMFTHIHHSATLRKAAGGWKVVAFEPRYVDMGSVRR
jgi:hypothetical protein